MKNKLIMLTICAATMISVLTVNEPLKVRAASKENIENKIESNKSKISDLESQKNQISKEKSNEKSKLDEIQSKLDSKGEELAKSQQKVDDYENKIDVVQNKISKVESEIGKLQEEIKNVEDEIKAKEKEKLEKENMLGSRLRNIYKTNYTEKMLAVLLSSRDLSDFISKFANFSKIVKIDQGLIKEVESIQEDLKKNEKELNAKRDTLNNNKKQIENQREELKKIQDEYLKERDVLEGQVNELKTLENEKNNIVNGLSDKEKELQNQISDLSSFNENLRKELDQIFANINSNSSSNGVISKENAGQGFIAPVVGTITCDFGPRTHPVTHKQGFHTGLDIGVSFGTPVKAAKGGIVVRAEYNSVYGNMVIIDHGNGVQSLYGHSSSLSVNKGQKVEQGQVIALAGSTGMSTGPHVHFEIRVNGQPVNPKNYI